MSKRLAVLLVLFGLIFVTVGFTSPKKSDVNRNRVPGWRDFSLQNGSLDDLGSSVSGGGNLTLAQSGSISPLITPPDNWNGGTGNWSNSGNWSAGEPGAGSDVTIYSGGTDQVTLDTGSTTINSLQLGGAYNGYSSELTDNGTNQTLNINGALNVGASGEISFSGSTSSITAGADSTNAGYIYLAGGSSLNINGNFNNSNYAYAEYGGSVINITGNLTNSGQFYEFGGGTATIGGNVTNSYYFGVQGGTTVNIGGNVNNSYVLYTDGGNLNITGTLTNSVDFELEASGDTASAASLVNTGYVSVVAGASLNLTNQPGGITDVAAGSEYSISGTFTAGGSNNAFYQLNSVEGQLLLYGQSFTDTPGSGTVTNSGYLSFGSGSNVTITGNVSNSGFLSTGYYGSGGNTLNITGTLTNNLQFYVYGAGDVANVGSLINNDQTYINSGATLNLTNQAAGVTDVAAGTEYNIYGTFTAGVNNALYNLTSVEGTVYLANGQTTGITPNGGTLTNSGTFALGDSSTLNITGNVANNGGFLSTGYYGSGGNTLNISGNLTNSGEFYVYGSGDVANVATLTNNGVTYVGTGATLNLTNQSGGLTDVGSGSTFYVYGNFNDVAGGANGFANLNSVEGSLYLYGQNFTMTPGSGTLTIANSGELSVNFNPDTLVGTNLTIAGNVNNSGDLLTGVNYSGASGNTLTITGNLTNNDNFWVYSPGDVANIASLTNNGYTYVGPGATLNLTSQPNGITDALSGSTFALYGAFNAGSNPGFANLTNVEGTVELFGQNFTMTPSGGTLTIASSGELTANYNPSTSVGTTLTISGNVNNSGFLATGYNNSGTGGNTLNITGNLTNNAGSDFWVYSSGDVANVATLTNGGYTYVAPGATLNLTNQAGGITDALAGSTFDLYGSFNDQVNHASGFANLTSVEGAVNLYDQSLAITPNGGTLTISSGGSLTANGELTSTSLTINGNVNNSGTLSTGYNFVGSGNTLTITGNLTTSGLLDFYGIGDTAQVNGNLQNSGVVELLNTNQTLNIGGNLTNAGSGAIYEYYGGQNINVSGTVDNSGILYQTNSGSGGNTLTVTGLLTNEASGQIEVLNAGDVLAANGGLTNLGTVTVSNGAAIDPPFLHNGGTINIDATSSMLVGTGSPGGQGYTQLANGTLGEIIASASNFGVINVTGAVSLAGTLDIMLQAGYDPSNGTQFKFLNFTANELTGSFSTVENTSFNGGTQMWVLNYNPMLGFVELTAEPVSASATFWLGGTGNWSTNADWSNGTPTAALDATIYSGLANDLVTLDQGTEFAKSLTIGGAPNTYTSELTDAGQSAQNLTITNGLTIGQTGTLSLVSGSIVTAGADSSNAGLIDLENASTLTINGNLTNTGTLETNNNGLGGGNNFTVSGNFSNSGSFSLNGSLDLANVGTITNTGSVYLGYGTQLNLSNQPGGVTDVPLGSSWQIYGSFTENSSNFGFENLASIEGTIDLENVQVSTINPGGINGTLTIASTGNFDIGNGTSLTITGSVDNSGYLSTGRYNVGGNTLNISGTLTNESGGQFIMWNGVPSTNSPYDTATLGALQNSGFLDVEGGSTLNITGNATSSGNMYTSYYGNNGNQGNTINIGGTLTNSGFIGLEAADTLTVTGVVTNSDEIALTGGAMATFQSDLNNSGTIDLENASTLTVNGNVTNTGTLETSAYGGTGSNILNLNGTLTNSGSFDLLGAGDLANVGMLTNNGNITVATGATLNLTAQPSGITDAMAGSDFELYGTFNAGGAPGFANLNSVEGTVNLYGQSFTITPGNGTLTIASGAQLAADYNPNNSTASSITIAGDVVNSGTLATGFNFYNGGNSLVITGNLNNVGGAGVGFGLFGSGDTAIVMGSVTNTGIIQLIGSGSQLTIGAGLANNSSGGFVDVESGSTLTINGDVTNNSGPGGFQGIYTNYLGDGGGNTINISGSLINTGTFQLGGPGDMATIGNGMNNSGMVNVDGGSTLNVTGDVTNSGTIQTDSIGNTVTISGMLINSGTFQLGGAGDMATIASLTNSIGGFVNAQNGSTLLITGNADNFGTVATSFSGGTGGNTLTIGGTLTNEWGGLLVLDGPGDMVSIGNGLSNAGFVDVEKGSTLAITGNVDNAGGFIYTSDYQSGGNTITISGMLTNEAGSQFVLLGPGDTASIGNGVSNAGTIDVDSASKLTISGNVNNSGTLATDLYSYGGGNTLSISGSLTNSGSFQLNGSGDTANIGGTLDNSGIADLTSGTTLNVTGLLTNEAAGSLTVAGGTLTAPGGLTNYGAISLTNGATVDPPTLTNGGVISIDSLSKFVVGSGGVAGQGYTQLANGTLNEIIAGANSFGVINVNGAVSLAGTLDIMLQAGYDPSNGTQFKFINFSGPLNGTFGSVLNDTFDNGNQMWVLNYNPALGFVELTAEAVASGATYWLGGPGTWSQNAMWSNGTPTASEAATINSGLANDFVTLDQGTEFAASLTLGGPSNPSNYTSELTDGGTAQNLTITAGLTVGQTGILYLHGGSTVTAGADSSNAGTIELDNASTLTVNGNLTNTGSLLTGATGGGNNSLNITGTLTNSGTFQLLGAGDTASIGNGMVNTGTVTMRSGETLQINGNVTNAGTIETNINGGNNTISISGTLTNNGEFELLHAGDVASIGSVVNSGTVDLYSAPGNVMFTVAGNFANSGLFFIENGVVASVGTLNNTGTVGVLPTSTLNLTSQPNGITDIVAGSTFNIGGTFTAGPNNAFYLLTSVEGNLYLYNQQTTSVTPTGGLLTIAAGGSVTADSPYGGQTVLQINGDLANAGTVDLERGSSVQIVGNFDNAGTLITNESGLGGNNTITVGGLLTNTPTGIITLNGSMDMLQALAGITNSGTINVNNGSTIDPPFFNNQGVVNIDSTSSLIVGTGHYAGTGYIQLANGVLGEMISSTSYGVINVNGSALLNGTLDILLQGNFDPSVGSTYKFLIANPGEVSGVFTSIENDIFNGGTEIWQITYDYADGYVEMIADPYAPPLPEPGTLLVLIPALLGAGFGLRRQLFR